MELFDFYLGVVQSVLQFTSVAKGRKKYLEQLKIQTINKQGNCSFLL